MNLEEQRKDNNIIRQAEQEKDPEGPPWDENMEESVDEFEHQKRSLAGFLSRVSTWIRNANACVADKSRRLRECSKGIRCGLGEVRQFL